MVRLIHKAATARFYSDAAGLTLNGALGGVAEPAPFRLYDQEEGTGARDFTIRAKKAYFVGQPRGCILAVNWR